MALPYRGAYGVTRSYGVDQLALPPHPMPSHHRSRPLKAWRYVGVYGPELMLCIGAVRIGRARQCFWAVWDRVDGRLYEQTTLGRRGVQLSRGRARIAAANVQADVVLSETAGVETVCASGASYGWTRKQGGVQATGSVVIDGRRRPLQARAVIDDTAAYYERHTRWYWSAGVGTAVDGRAVAWSLVDGVNDPPLRSERTIWIDGDPLEAPPCRFAPDLSRVDRLGFAPEATRERRENLLLIRSVYRQPFGTFSGELPGQVQLAEGYGVMESHDVRW